MLQILSLFLSFSLFGILTLDSWKGQLGLSSAALLILSIGLFVYGRKKISSSWRGWLTFFAKALITVVGIMALLRHPIDTDVQTLQQEKALIHVYSTHSVEIKSAVTIYDTQNSTTKTKIHRFY